MSEQTADISLNINSILQQWLDALPIYCENQIDKCPLKKSSLSEMYFLLDIKQNFSIEIYKNFLKKYLNLCPSYLILIEQFILYKILLDNIPASDIQIFTKKIELNIKFISQIYEDNYKNRIKDIQSQYIDKEKKKLHITQKLQEIKDQLEDRNDEFRAIAEQLQLKNKQLNETQGELLKTEKMAAIGEMAGRIAHEVLNPITSVMIRIELNLKEEDKSESIASIFQEIIQDWEKKFNQGILENSLKRMDESNNQKSFGELDFEILFGTIKKLHEKEKKYKKDLQFLSIQFQRIVKIIDSLRGLSRVTRIVQDREISYPIKEALELMKDTIKKRFIEIRENYPDPLPIVRADINELIQIFSNVIKNSIHAIEDTDKKERLISIKVSTTDKRVEIKIQDNGIGISPEYQKQIFKHSFTTKKHKAGTGIGLQISRHLIRENNGDIELEKTEVGQGTTFLVWLPKK